MAQVHLWRITLARRRVAKREWLAGGAFVVVLAPYIYVWIQPDYSLIPTARAAGGDAGRAWE